MLLFHSHKPENDRQRITSRVINHASTSCLQGAQRNNQHLNTILDTPVFQEFTSYLYRKKIHLLYFHCILKFSLLVERRIDTLGKHSEFLADFLIFHVFKDITIASLLTHYAFWFLLFSDCIFFFELPFPKLKFRQETKSCAFFL